MVERFKTGIFVIVLLLIVSGFVAAFVGSSLSCWRDTKLICQQAEGQVDCKVEAEFLGRIPLESRTIEGVEEAWVNEKDSPCTFEAPCRTAYRPEFRSQNGPELLRQCTLGKEASVATVDAVNLFLQNPTAEPLEIYHPLNWRGPRETLLVFGAMAIYVLYIVIRNRPARPVPQAPVDRKLIKALRDSPATSSKIGGKSPALGHRTGLGSHYLLKKEYDEAIEHYELALTTAKESQDLEEQAAQLANLGSAYRAAGRRGQATDYYEKALLILEQIGSPNAEVVRRW